MAREYGTSVETSATPEQVWRVWSDMTTWGAWNPNVTTMSWSGGFAAGTSGVMNTPAGQHHQMQLVDVVPGRSFALLTAVVPLTTFRFNCRIVAASGARTRVEQTVEVRGPLGPVLGGYSARRSRRTSRSCSRTWRERRKRPSPLFLIYMWRCGPERPRWPCAT